MEEGAMPVAQSRRFTLADSMVLIAATAVGLSVTKPYAEFLWDRSGAIMSHWAARAVATINGLVPPTLAALTLAVLVLRLRRPRPRLRRVFRQPGAVASAAVATSAVLGALMVAYSAAVSGWSDPNLPIGITAAMAASLVTGSWMALAIGGRWHPERSWPDRAGRTLGWWWVGLVFLGLLAYPWQFISVAPPPPPWPIIAPIPPPLPLTAEPDGPDGAPLIIEPERPPLPDLPPR
jgi:hypothetical protein